MSTQSGAEGIAVLWQTKDKGANRGLSVALTGKSHLPGSKRTAQRSMSCMNACAAALLLLFLWIRGDLGKAGFGTLVRLLYVALWSFRQHVLVKAAETPGSDNCRKWSWRGVLDS